MKNFFIYLTTFILITIFLFFLKLYPSISVQMEFFKNIILLCSILFTVMGLWLSLFYNEELKDLLLEKENKNLENNDHLENIEFLINPMISSAYILILSLIVLGISTLQEPILNCKLVQYIPNKIITIKEIIKSISFAIIIFSTIKIIDNIRDFIIPLRAIIKKIKKKK